MSLVSWTVLRLSELLIGRVRSWFSLGTLAAVATIEVSIMVAQCACLVLGIVTNLTFVYSIVDVIPNVMRWLQDDQWLGIPVGIPVGILTICFIFPPLVLAEELLAISRGNKSTLGSVAAGMARVRQLQALTIPFLFVMAAILLLSVPLRVLVDYRLGLMGLAGATYFLLEILRSAVWQNQNIRGLVVASMSHKLF